MPLNSMTGFSRGSGVAEGHRWNWEVKTVNNKGLDVRVKFPTFLDGFDVTVKKLVSTTIARGSVFISLNVESDGDEEAFVVREDRLQSLLDIAAKYADKTGVQPAKLDGLLAIKGIVELSTDTCDEKTRGRLEEELLKSLKNVLADLCSARADEGSRMASILNEQLSTIEQLALDARALSGDRLEAMNARFKQQLAKITQSDVPVSEERMAQEIAIISVKADIQEELDRLDSHVVEAKKLLAQNKAVGRRLDFLCQEFNREANTLCSKSGDTALTKIGLDLKTVIDQFREQIQNIE